MSSSLAGLSPFQQAFLASFTDGVSSPAVPASVTAELVRLRALPVLKLRRECKKKGLNPKGGKAEVLERLEAVVRQAIPAGLPAAAGVAAEAKPVGSVDDLFAFLARKGESKVAIWWSCPLCDADSERNAKECGVCGNEACESDFAPARQLDAMLEAAAENSSPAEFGSRYLEAAAQRAIDGDFEEVRAVQSDVCDASVVQVGKGRGDVCCRSVILEYIDSLRVVGGTCVRRM